jgi:signal transduction histidine kinase
LLVYLSLRPLRELVRATRRIATPRFRVMEERGPDEVRRLIRAFNTMQTRIDELFEANVQTMLAIGHDLRTPLARLQLRLETHALDGPERQAIEADIEEMRDLLASLQTYLEADSPPGTGERVDLAAMAQTQVDQAVDCGRDADYTGPDRLPVLTNAVALRPGAGQSHRQCPDVWRVGPCHARRGEGGHRACRRGQRAGHCRGHVATRPATVRSP